MYLEYNVDGHFEAATGTLQVEKSDEIVRFESMMWTGDTFDSVASSFIIHIFTKKLPLNISLKLARVKKSLIWSNQTSTTSVKERKEKGGEEEEVTWKKNVNPRPLSLPQRRILHHISIPSIQPEHYARLTLPRPHTPISPQRPCHLKYHSTNPPGGEQHPLARRNMHMFLASGFDIIFWAFVLISHIFLDPQLTTPFPLEDPTENTPMYWGSIKTYQSSPGVTRTFCGTCGANVS
jgi:hypothetical protein